MQLSLNGTIRHHRLPDPFAQRVVGGQASKAIAFFSENVARRLVGQQNVPVDPNARHRVGVQLKELGKFLNSLFAEAAADFLATNVGHALHHAEVEGLEKSRQRVLAVDDTYDLPIAPNGNGHLAAADRIVHDIRPV